MPSRPSDRQVRPPRLGARPGAPETPGADRSVYLADLPRRPAEGPLKAALLILALLGLAGPGPPSPLAAQEEGGADPEPARAAAYLELGSGLGLLRGKIMPLARGSALVTISSNVRVGGGGTVFPGEVEVGGDLVRPNRDLGFGYGGVLVEVGPESPSERGRLTLQTLIGAGGVEVRDRQTGTRLASDNVVVLEPAIVFRWGGFSRLDLGLSASWRAVLGGEDVDGVGGGDLSEPALVVQLRLGPL